MSRLVAAHGVIEAAPDKRYVSITTLDSEMMRLGFLIYIFEELFGEPIFLSQSKFSFRGKLINYYTCPPIRSLLQ